MMNSILNLESVVVEGIIPEGLGRGMLPSSLVTIGVKDANKIKAAELLEEAAIEVVSRYGYLSEIAIMDLIAPFSEGWCYFHDKDGVDSSRRIHEGGAEAGFSWKDGCWCFYITPANSVDRDYKYEAMAEELGY